MAELEVREIDSASPSPSIYQPPTIFPTPLARLPAAPRGAMLIRSSLSINFDSSGEHVKTILSARMKRAASRSRSLAPSPLPSPPPGPRFLLGLFVLAPGEESQLRFPASSSTSSPSGIGIFARLYSRRGYSG